MEKDIFINFCLRQHPDYDGTYTAQSLFRKALNTYFIELQMPGYNIPSEADFTVPGSTNPNLCWGEIYCSVAEISDQSKNHKTLTKQYFWRWWKGLKNRVD